MTIESKMHELLCAYALGEADAAQKIEVERALAASAELRAELQRIEGTIGLVRESLGGGETLSREAEEALLSAIEPAPRARPWYSGGWMRMAASVAVLGGGVLLMREMNSRNEAQLQMPSGRLADRGEEARKDAPAAKAVDASTLIAQLDEKEQRAAKAEGLDGAKADSTKMSLDTLAAAEPPALKDAENTPPDPNVIGARGGEGNKILDLHLLEKDATSKSTDQLTDSYYTWRDTAALGESKPGAEKQNPPPPAEPLAHAGRRLDPGAPGSGGKGTYRGPGDSAPAGAGGGGGGAGAPAPSRPGASPSGPSTGGPSSPAPLAASSAPAKRNKDLPALESARQKDRAAGDDRSTAGKAKNGELAKKSAEQKQDADSEALSFDKAQAQNPAAEAQFGLRRLLERSDRAEAERLARLRGEPQFQEEEKFRHLGYAGPDSRADEMRLRELYMQLTPEQRAQLLDSECRRVFDGCRRLPDERPRDMFFRYWGDNPFEITALDGLSTFSADVDTASYALARRYLIEGKLPEKAQIRTEEFVNYFKADVPPPTKGTFAIHTDLAPSRFAQPANSTWTLRVVVRGEELAKEERKPLHLTCVIDCSGSMREQNRMETVKDTLRLLLSQLNAADMVGIVAFSTEARQILPLTSAAQKGLIEAGIAQLYPDGWTNSEAGLRLGYETALAGLDANSTNRVVFLSDGVANKGITDPVQLSDTLKPIRERGVYLNTIGVGMNNHNDTLLEQLADKGDGMCSYVDDMREARRVMMDNFMGSLETIARDVKIQVEFDPAQVVRYRLLGYENRAVADADFRNDKVDAGEVGSGHQVTALYELERNLATGSERPLATVRVRYKAPRLVNGPANEEANEIQAEVRGSQQTSFDGADVGYRRAVIVGQFAEFLRRSVHARGRSLDDLLAEARKLQAQLPQDAEFREFVALAEKSKELVLRGLPNCDELCQAIDAYRTWQFQCAERERISHERQQQIVDDLARRNREMEEQIRELLRRRLENSPK